MALNIGMKKTNGKDNVSTNRLSRSLSHMTEWMLQSSAKIEGKLRKLRKGCDHKGNIIRIYNEQLQSTLIADFDNQDLGS